MKERVANWIKQHLSVTFLTTCVVSAIFGWFICLILPSKPVIASNIPKKELTCVLNYSHALVKKYLTDERLQITYDGQPVSSPYLYDISIQNTGSIEIDNDDFKDDFILKFSGSGNILSAQVNRSTNIAVRDDVLSGARINGEELVIENFFLNPGEEFSIVVITNNISDSIKYHERISGISEISLRNTPKEKHNRFLWFSIFALSLLFLTLIGFVIENIHSTKKLRQLYEKEINTSNYKTQININKSKE